MYVIQTNARWMKKLMSCAFNMNSGYAELKFVGDSPVAINCAAVDGEVADNMYEQSKP